MKKPELLKFLRDRNYKGFSAAKKAVLEEKVSEIEAVEERVEYERKLREEVKCRSCLLKQLFSGEIEEDIHDQRIVKTAGMEIPKVKKNSVECGKCTEYQKVQRRVDKEIYDEKIRMQKRHDDCEFCGSVEFIQDCEDTICGQCFAIQPPEVDQFNNFFFDRIL